MWTELFHLFHLWSQICMRWVFFLYIVVSTVMRVNSLICSIVLHDNPYGHCEGDQTLYNSFKFWFLRVQYSESFFRSGTNTFNKQTSYRHNSVWFSNSLIIHKDKIKEYTSLKEVWICDPNIFIMKFCALLLWIFIKHSKEHFIRYPNASKLAKKLTCASFY